MVRNELRQDFRPFHGASETLDEFRYLMLANSPSLDSPGNFRHLQAVST